MKDWQRVLLVIASVAALYPLWRFPPNGFAAVVLGIGSAWLGRNIYRSKLAANPMGVTRDYSLRPVATAFAKFVGLFAAALLWTGLMAYAARHNYVPDTGLGVAVVFGPSLALLAIGLIYLGKALIASQFGGKPPGVSSQ